MAKKNKSVPQYGTVTRKGILYYRTRIQDADGKHIVGIHEDGSETDVFVNGTWAE